MKQRITPANNELGYRGESYVHPEDVADRQIEKQSTEDIHTPENTINTLPVVKSLGDLSLREADYGFARRRNENSSPEPTVFSD